MKRKRDDFRCLLVGFELCDCNSKKNKKKDKREKLHSLKFARCFFE
jgi:hypothetical protein